MEKAQLALNELVKFGFKDTAKLQELWAKTVRDLSENHEEGRATLDDMLV